MEAAPLLFRCPISMELMEDPVTIATGVTYERKNIEKWLFTYKKSTCPATMQRLETFDLTPNHTLKRLISSFNDRTDDEDFARAPTPPSSSSSSSTAAASELNELESLLQKVETGPFKASCLRKLRSLIEKKDVLQKALIRSGGVQVLTRVILHESSDFAAFQACEEALGVLSNLPVSDEATTALLLKPDCVKSIAAVLQRGSAEARGHAMSVLMKISRVNHEWADGLGVDVFKSLLELLSDEISTKLSSASLDVLLEIVSARSSKKTRVRAVEAGAVSILVELLPEASRHGCEKALLLLKRLCECPEGRAAFDEHGLGVAAVSKKMLRVSEAATKLGVKILWLMSMFLPTEKLVEDMVAFGAVRKLLALLHCDGRSSTKEKAVGIFKLHGGRWRQCPCFPCEWKDLVRLTHA